MPGELGRENQITGLHDALLAVDRRVSTAALNDEAQRRRRMAVRPRVLAGLEVLEGNLDRVRGKGALLVEARVNQTHHAPLAIFEADHFARAHQTLVHVRPLPKTRLDGSHRLRRQSFHAETPITRKIFPRHVAVEERYAIASSRPLHDRSPPHALSRSA